MSYQLLHTICALIPRPKAFVTTLAESSSDTLAPAPFLRVTAGEISPQRMPKPSPKPTKPAATKTPVVSVLTPTYNCAEHLARTWWCLQNQTFTEWEWIVTDDGSTDGTEALVKSFADPRIRYHKLPRNLGRGGARAAGLAKATGTYVAIWDADDIYPLTRLATAVKELKRDGTDFWCSHTMLLDNTLTPTGIRTWPSLPECKRIFVFHTMVVKREILQAIGFDSRWRAAEDYRPLLSVIMHHKGTWHEAPLACYIENREANVAKAILTNSNQYAQFTEMQAKGEFNPPLEDPAAIAHRFLRKLKILKLMSIYPPLYKLTLKLREADRTTPVSPAMAKFLKQVAAVK